MNRKKVLHRIAAAVMVILVLIFVYSSGSFLKIWMQLKKEQQALEELAALTETAWGNDKTEPSGDSDKKEKQDASRFNRKSGSALPQMPDLRVLYEKNQDTAGWVMIPDTKINYPVMQTREEPQFYLHRNFEKQKAYCGLPFADALCRIPDGPVLMIYGHHMKNGMMFADLMKYQEKQFAQEHPQIYFNSLSESGTYLIFSAFYADMEAPEDTFHYETGLTAVTEEQVDAYAKKLKAASLYDTGVMPEKGEQILVLSTCSYHVEDGRFAVAAVRRKTEEP